MREWACAHPMSVCLIAHVSVWLRQDNNVDSTSSLKENVEMEDLKQGKSEMSYVIYC